MMDADERKLLEDAVDTMTARGDGRSLTSALDSFGWIELLGRAPEIAVPIVFGAQGRHGAWSAAFHDLLARELDPGWPGTDTTVLIPRPGTASAGRLVGETASIDGICVGARAERRWLIAVVEDERGAPVLVRLAAGDVRPVPADGLDSRLCVERVRSPQASLVSVLLHGADAVTRWSATVAAGQRALCHQIAGVMQAMLELALDHAREREQFGRRIGTFQAVRHKLAEALVATTASEAAVEASWDSADQPLASATAKLVTSRACSVVIAHTQQVLAGIGFTAEHPYHLLMKRAIVLDRLLGSAVDLAPAVGRRVATLGYAPRLVEL